MAKESGTFLLIGGIAALGFAWYKGYLAQFGLPGPSAAAPATQLTAAQVAAILAMQQGAQATGTPAQSTPPVSASIPALGTTVKSASDVAAQASAKDAYILPDAATFNTVGSVPGYQAFVLTDAGNVFLRNDVAIAANQQVGSTGKPIALADLQKLMASSGLSGFAGYMQSRTGRARPYRVM